MAYKALYRTYRPSTFEEVAGQEHIVKTLKNALATNKIAHAYLFTGPRGTGKTTMARLFAKALNCEHGLGCQCNECRNCKEIADGSHPDVLEIDAASNRGINEIKDLIEKVKYSCILGRYKVYIIDEVHMITPEAFNALLKTLEEPPAHVIFILATTEPHKILPTILSRCQRYDFTKVSDKDIKERLKIVLEKENVTYVDEAVDTIISLADGGMRDALSILDQVLAYSGNTLNVDDILNIFSLESKDEKVALIKNIAQGQVGEVLTRMSKYIQKGTDVKRLTNDLLLILKDVLIYSLTYRKDLFQFLDVKDAKDLVNYLTSNRILEMIDILLNATKEYKNVNDINPLFEVTLLKLANTKNVAITPIEPSEDDDYEEEIKPIPTPIKKEEIKIETPQPQKKEEVVEKPIEEVEKPLKTPANEEIIEEVKEKIFSSKALILSSAVNGESLSIPADTIIRMMACSKKELKKNFINDWKKIKTLMTSPTHSHAASILVDAYPLVVSNKFLIMVLQFPNMVEKANLLSNQLALQHAIEEAFDKRLFIYAVSRSESVELQKKFMDLYAVGKVPHSSEDDFILTEEEI